MLRYIKEYVNKSILYFSSNFLQLCIIFISSNTSFFIEQILSLINSLRVFLITFVFCVLSFFRFLIIVNDFISLWLFYVWPMPSLRALLPGKQVFIVDMNNSSIYVYIHDWYGTRTGLILQLNGKVSFCSLNSDHRIIDNLFQYKIRTVFWFKQVRISFPIYGILIRLNCKRGCCIVYLYCTWQSFHK